MRLFCSSRWMLPALALSVLTTQASAVVLYSSSDRNLDPPGSLTNRAGSYGAGQDDPRYLLNSGWQWQGQYGDFLGTPIAPQYFITAQHIGALWSSITLDGTHAIDGSFNGGLGYVDDPNSDLRIFKITDTFSSYAPLYDTAVDGSEVGKQLIVFGRGRARGDELHLNDDPAQPLKGWKWGVHDGLQSWGENIVSGLANQRVDNDQRLLSFDFDADGIPNESALSEWDSGGGLFINSGGVWKLAAINYGVDDPFRTSATGPDIYASVFDASGLFFNFGSQQNPDWQQVSSGVAASYSTRISPSLSWIMTTTGLGSGAVVSTPEPSAALGVFLALLCTCVMRRRSHCSSAD